MNADLTKRCTLVLLLSMTLGLAAGLVAWGPMVLGFADPVYAGAAAGLGMAPAAAAASAINALACLPLCGVCIWGLNNVLHSDWPADAVRPWVGFYVAAFLMSASAGLQHIDPDRLGCALTHTFAAAGFLLLLLAFLSERADARFGSAAACSAAVALALGSGGWWLAGELRAGGGDLRALLLLQALPALLIPAGALRLRGSRTAGGDWLIALGVYAMARLAGATEWADEAVFAATGWLGGHAVMHLLLAAGTGGLAYRAGTPVDSPALAGSSVVAGSGRVSLASQRSASATTSGW